MNIRSAKAKGRRLAIEVKEKLLSAAPHLENADFHVQSASVPGEDLVLSPRAKETYPYVFECKNCEQLNIWKAVKQAEGYLKNPNDNSIVVFSRNRAKTYAVIEFDEWLRLTQRGTKKNSTEANVELIRPKLAIG